MPEANSVIALLLLLSATTGRADVLEIPATPSTVTLPAKGSSMNRVVSHYGEPQLKHAAVGGGAPKQPPITRWDYPGYSVFFENDHVVDAVVPTAPATIHHKEELGSVQ